MKAPPRRLDERAAIVCEPNQPEGFGPTERVELRHRAWRGPLFRRRARRGRRRLRGRAGGRRFSHAGGPRRRARLVGQRARPRCPAAAGYRAPGDVPEDPRSDGSRTGCEPVEHGGVVLAGGGRVGSGRPASRMGRGARRLGPRRRSPGRARATCGAISISSCFAGSSPIAPERRRSRPTSCAPSGTASRSAGRNRSELARVVLRAARANCVDALDSRSCQIRQSFASFQFSPIPTSTVSGTFSAGGALHGVPHDGGDLFRPDRGAPRTAARRGR